MCMGFWGISTDGFPSFVDPRNKPKAIIIRKRCFYLTLWNIIRLGICPNSDQHGGALLLSFRNYSHCARNYAIHIYLHHFNQKLFDLFCVAYEESINQKRMFELRKYVEGFVCCESNSNWLANLFVAICSSYVCVCVCIGVYGFV